MKLLDQLVMACRTMNFAPATETCYVSWVEQYLRFHRNRNGAWVHPDELHEPAVEFFLSHLAVHRQLSASTQTQAMCDLVFFYREVLQRPLGTIAAFRAKRPERVPTVLSVGGIAPGDAANKLGGTGFQPVHREQQTRRNLPHIQSPGRTYHVIFRTVSLQLPEPARRVAFDSCLYWNGRKCEVHAGVVMRDHIHMLLTPGTAVDGIASVSLSEILHSIKSYSSNAINALLQRTGRVWMDESYDRYIRSESDFEEKYEYIRNNPVKDGLVERWDHYEFLYLQWG